MWVKARQVLARWTAPEPSLTPAQRTEAAAIRQQTEEQRAWMKRLERIQEERQQEQAMREAAEAAERAALQARLAARREEILDACARYGYWWPGDVHIPRERPRSWIGRVLDVVRGGGH